jgi:hypothetical protein
MSGTSPRFLDTWARVSLPMRVLVTGSLLIVILASLIVSAAPSTTTSASTIEPTAASAVESLPPAPPLSFLLPSPAAADLQPLDCRAGVVVLASGELDRAAAQKILQTIQTTTRAPTFLAGVDLCAKGTAPSSTATQPPTTARVMIGPFVSQVSACRFWVRSLANTALDQMSDTAPAWHTEDLSDPTSELRPFCPAPMGRPR